jgi:hypothetical protein
MTFDEFAEKYGLVCDVVERTYHGWPLDRTAEHDPGLGHLQTSAEARAAASRIFEILGVDRPPAA